MAACCWLVQRRYRCCCLPRRFARRRSCRKSSSARQARSCGAHRRRQPPRPRRRRQRRSARCPERCRSSPTSSRPSPWFRTRKSAATAARTLGDLLFGKPGITGSSFAPGASSRPIIRGLDVNRVRIQEDGIGANGASDLGEDHFVPVDPLATNQVEVIRGPATLRYGSQAIGGVVETTNNRIPEALPCDGHAPPRCGRAALRARSRRAARSRPSTTASTAACCSMPAPAILPSTPTSSAATPTTTACRSIPISSRPIRPTRRTRRSQRFNGRQPNSALRTDGGSVGGSYVFSDGFVGLAVTQNNALYHIPGIDGEDHDTRIDARQTKVISQGRMARADGGRRRHPVLGRRHRLQAQRNRSRRRHRSRQRRRAPDLHQQGTGRPRRSAVHAVQSARSPS